MSGLCHDGRVRDGGLARSAGSRTLRTALWLSAAAIGLLTAVEVALLVGVGGPTAVLLMFPATGVVYAVVGALAWVRRPANRMGPLFTAGGLVWLAAGLNNTAVAPLVAVGQIVATVPIALVLHALLAFPSGRLRGPLAHALVAAGYGATIVLQAPIYLFGAEEGNLTPLRVADRPDLAATGQRVQAVTVAVLIAVTSVVLLRRLLAARGRRRVLGPLYLFGVFAIVGVTASKNLLARLVELPPLAVPVVQISVLAGVPVAFIAATLRGGFARTAELEELGAWLGRHGPGHRDLGGAVARALGDPSATLLYRVEPGNGQPGYWAEADGTRTSGPDDPHARRAPVAVGDREIAAIRYDAELIRDPEEVLAVGRVAAMALGHQQLTTQLLATRDELLDSRTRLLQAGDRERRRLAQDLHDRLQSRLVLLGMHLGTVAARPDLRGDPAVDQVRSGLDEALTELRSLVQGVMPALLIERGLAAALAAMADRCPVPTVLEVDDTEDTRLPSAVETTAYHVVSEALANVVKHAAADAATVRVRRHGGTRRLEIADDGVGGARPGRGLGLPGIADRVTALRGTLAVDSAPGTGTRVIVEMPCGS